MEGLEVIVYLILLVAFWIYRGMKRTKEKQRRRERMMKEGGHAVPGQPETKREPVPKADRPATFEDIFREIFDEPAEREQEPPPPVISRKKETDVPVFKEKVGKKVVDIYGDYSKGTPKAKDLSREFKHATDLSRDAKHATDLTKRVQHARDLHDTTYKTVRKPKFKPGQKIQFDLKQAIINQVILERPYR